VRIFEKESMRDKSPLFFDGEKVAIMLISGNLYYQAHFVVNDPSMSRPFPNSPL
jgi:hypothetical protein